MIRAVIDCARKRHDPEGGWRVLHPSNDAILAYCDSEAEADACISTINLMAEAMQGMAIHGKAKS